MKALLPRETFFLAALERGELSSVLKVAPRYPSEMLGSEAMRKLMLLWRTVFDHILIDAPPILAVTDAVALRTIADAVIVVARSGVTGYQSLCRARDILRKVNAKIAGVVVNDLGPNSAGYAGYYGHCGFHYTYEKN